MKEGAPPGPGGARFLGFEPARLALVVALAAGAFFRIWGYGARASLGLDEARLALNIAGRSYGGLLRPLDYDQAAPLLFLWAEKLATQIGGVNELALRALPFAAGMVLPFLVLALGARLAGRPAGMVAAGLAAVAWPLVRYSFELKPYEVDALVCTGLLLLCLPRSGGPDKPAMGPAAAVGGALAVWASAPAVFVLAALGAWAGMAARRFPAVRREVLGTLVLWAASFAGAYALVYRPAATNSYLHEFWADYLVRVGDQLDLQYDPYTKMYQAPFQLKANGGVLILDDFGRQRIPPRDLLNRWIVPLEKRIDFLSLHTGGKFPVPFDCLLIFSTNLAPHELVEEAFLRRIHYKLHVPGPTRENYAEIFRRCCAERGIPYAEWAVPHLYREYYGRRRITPRNCHPRDILDHFLDMTRYLEAERVLTPELLDHACQSYFLDAPQEVS